MKQTPVEVSLVPILSDNYVHVLHNKDLNLTTLVDPGHAAPVIEFLESRQWTPQQIILTHHHGDHIEGVSELVNKYHCEVFGPAYDHHRIPNLDHQKKDGDSVLIAGQPFEIWHLPGHTTGHIAYISKDQTIAFTGDVLFGFGCGRLFEGTSQEMYRSLARIKNLPGHLLIYCTHEYTLQNAEFAAGLLPQDKNIKTRIQKVQELRRKNQSTVPLLLSEELLTNPFLLADNWQDFHDYRAARDKFRAKINND